MKVEPINKTESTKKDQNKKHPFFQPTKMKYGRKCKVSHIREDEYRGSK